MKLNKFVNFIFWNTDCSKKSDVLICPLWFKFRNYIIDEIDVTSCRTLCYMYQNAGFKIKSVLLMSLNKQIFIFQIVNPKILIFFLKLRFLNYWSSKCSILISHNYKN